MHTGQNSIYLHQCKSQEATTHTNDDPQYDAQSVNDLAQLSTINVDRFPSVFVKSLTAIFNYSVYAIKRVISPVAMDVLSTTHKQLYERVIELFPQYKGRRIINRTVTHRMVADVIQLGLCIVNKDTSKELENIFLEPLHDTPCSDDSSGVSYTQYVELIGTIAKLAQRMDNTEQELRWLKSERCSKCVCKCVPTDNT